MILSVFGKGTVINESICSLVAFNVDRLLEKDFI